MSLCKLDVFKRLTMAGRIMVWNSYSRANKRLNPKTADLELVLVNKNNDNVWMPINYCVAKKPSEADLEEMRNSLD